MLVNKQDIGVGQRSWRYAMLVKDGVIEKICIATPTLRCRWTTPCAARRWGRCPE